MKIKEIILVIIILLFSNIAFSQSNKLCSAQFGYSINRDISPLTYQFFDSSYSQNTIIQWEWDFGNGEQSTKQNPEHQYLNEGIYLVSLKITDNLGFSDIAKDTIRITKQNPPTCNAYFTYVFDTAGANYTYRFFDHSIHTNDSIISWSWDFGDSSPTSHLQNPIHQFSSIGTYVVTLDIQTAANCNSNYSTTIIVTNGTVNCAANFTQTEDTISGTPYTILFHDNSLHFNPITKWTWYFGDGDSSNYQDPSHSFPYPGIYNVKLKIKTSNCSDEIEIPIQVGNPQNYNLWGRVYVGNLTTDKCIAYLFRDYNNNCIKPIDTVQLTSVNDTLGVYYFYQIPEGNVKVQVVLPPSSQYSNDFAPTYYNSSPLWQNSQSIPLFQDLSMQNVNMQSVLPQVGTNYIQGSVANQANGQIEGVLVLLTNTQNDIIDYTFTDANGEYSFSQVPQGQFQIYGDLAGFDSYPASGTLSANNDSLFGVNFIINATTINTYIESDNKIENKTFKIYPNPVSDAKLFYSIDNQDVKSKFLFKIYNSLGSVVLQGWLSNSNTIDIDKLQSGIYFINIYEDNTKSLGVKKFIVR
jgi:PKD repeat protein